MIVTFIRSFIIFLTLVVVMRFLGKRQIGEMQPYEFIVTLIIADLACVPMSDVSIPLIYGVVGILALFLFHQILSVLESTGNLFKHVISGRPSIVLNKDGVDLRELKRNCMGVEDLIESMRSMGYYSLDDLEYAIFESNGKLSPFPKTDIENKGKSIPLLLVSDGKFQPSNLVKTGFSPNELKDVLKEKGGIKNVEVMTVDGDGRVYLKKKKEKYEVFSVGLKEGVKW